VGVCEPLSREIMYINGTIYNKLTYLCVPHTSGWVGGYVLCQLKCIHIMTSYNNDVIVQDDYDSSDDCNDAADEEPHLLEMEIGSSEDEDDIVCTVQ